MTRVELSKGRSRRAVLLALPLPYEVRTYACETFEPASAH